MKSSLPDTAVLHAMPSNSDTAVVSFSSMGPGHAQFHFFRLLQPLPGYSKLLVRDPSSNWYNAGLPGVGDTIAEIGKRLEREVEELGATRVITFGFSMGGYAAILFGCMLGAERTIALSPQTLLDPELYHSPPADVELQAPDLVPFVSDASGLEIDLVAGWDDHMDVFHAQRLAGLSSVRVLAMRNQTHAFVMELHREGRLAPLITQLVEGTIPDSCEVNPTLDPDDERRIAEMTFASQRGDWKTVVERIEPVAMRYPDWAGPNFDLGRALAKIGNPQGASAACARAIRANPNLEEARRYVTTADPADGKYSR